MDIELSSSLLTVVAVYFCSTAYLLAVAGAAARVPRPTGPEQDLFFVLVVPALNEEMVIGNTVRHLLELVGANFLVLVIDDGSDDGTARAVEAFPASHVRLVRRHGVFSRQGKGEALNHAYRTILTSELPSLYGLDHIVMGVMDADGQVDPEMLKKVGPYFTDEKTAAVQVAVRMLNGSQNFWTRWQQVEFVTFNWIFSRARETLGSVGLGGNGQFVRMSALASLAEGPWSDCLTEDLDIGLRLALVGWRNRYCHDAKVYQQAVEEPKRLIRQRSRWFQGHLSCWKHTKAVLLSDWPAYRKADVLNYLLAPGLVLPLGIFSAVTFPLMFVPGLLPWGFGLNIFSVSNIINWYVLSLGTAPLLALALVSSKEMSIWRSLLWGHIFVVLSYVWLVAGIMAVKRMLGGRRGWLKTARMRIDSPEPVTPGQDTRGATFLAERPMVAFSAETRQLTPPRAENFAPRRDGEQRPYTVRAPQFGRGTPTSVHIARARALLFNVAREGEALAALRRGDEAANAART